jgi:hypothetical protein
VPFLSRACIGFFKGRFFREGFGCPGGGTWQAIFSLFSGFRAKSLKIEDTRCLRGICTVLGEFLRKTSPIRISRKAFDSYLCLMAQLKNRAFLHLRMLFSAEIGHFWAPIEQFKMKGCLASLNSFERKLWNWN